MRENRTSGSMRGCWGSRTVGLVRHRQTKGAGTARPDLLAGGQCSTLPHYVPALAVCPRSAKRREQPNPRPTFLVIAIHGIVTGG